MIDNIENIIRNCQILIKTEVRIHEVGRDDFLHVNVRVHIHVHVGS